MGRCCFGKTTGSHVGLLPKFVIRSMKRSRCSARNGDEFMVKLDEFTAATRRAVERKTTEPSAVAAHYDRRRGRIVVSLSNGLELAFPPDIAQGLEKAKAHDLAD